MAPPAAPVSEPLTVAPLAASVDPAVFEPSAQHLNGVDPLSGSIETEDEFTGEGASAQVTSAASMATEILSASPEVATTVAEPEVSEAELISKDLTLIARGRKRRFRLH
jgi:hypothetical protein